MPIYSDIKGQTSVVCGILHTEVTSMAWSLGLRRLQPWTMPVIPLSGRPFDEARNLLAMRALECGAEWLFFLDSDVVPPEDAVPRLIARGKPLISGIYARRSPPMSLPVMMRGGRWVEKYPANTLIEVDVVGAGCMLIHRSILEKLPPQRPGKHWFDWRVDMQAVLPPGECLSEDYTFCYHVKRQLGIPTVVDTSVICRHIGLGESTPGNFGPVNTY